jgi:hypothetical protein
MSALKKDRNVRVRAGDAVGMIDCGRASKRTRGFTFGLFLETAALGYSIFPY